jgi:hypothetical protein
VRFVWKGCLFCDFEAFDFLHLEISGTPENLLPVECSAVVITEPKLTITVGVCFAVIANSNVPTKPWTTCGITHNLSTLFRP